MGSSGSPNLFPPFLGRSISRAGRWGNRIFATATGLGALLVVVLLAALFIFLYVGAESTINLFGWSFLTIVEWSPAPTNVYGVVPFIDGTLISSAIALLIGVPLSLGAAIFLTQQAPLWIRRPLTQLIELLAAIPSIIYGFWALIVLVPIMRTSIEPSLQQSLGWTGLFNGTPTGLDILTASVVLGVMVIPTITAISHFSLAAVPVSQKEAALSLGATTWEVSRHSVLPYARAGVFAGIVLGLGRAMGETMAVTLVIGNANYVPTSLFSHAATVTSLLANQFLEVSGPLELSALIEAGLILLIITTLVNVGARVTLSRLQIAQSEGQE